MSEEVKKEEEEEVKPEVDETKEKVDEFDTAFDDAVEGKPQTLEADPDPDPKLSETKDDPPVDPPMDPPVDDPLSPKGDVEPPQDPPVKTREEELEEELERGRQKMATWEGRIRAANEKAEEAQREVEALRQAKEKKDDLPDDDEEKALKEFEEEFPELIQPVITLVKKELLPIIGQMISDRLGDIEPEVTLIKKKMKTDSTEAHFKAIADKHSDWKQIVKSGALDKWIDSQPSYIKSALTEVKAGGGTEEVVDMFTQYKQSTGQTPVKKDPPLIPTPTPKEQDLLAVPSSPTPITTQGAKKDKDDFDTGWDDAMKKEK